MKHRIASSSTSNIVGDMADSDTRSGRAALLTVGSTQFAALVEAALRAETLAVLRDAGYTRFVVQYGKQDRPRLSTSHEGPKIQVELHAFLSDIEEKMQTVDLVLSHAGVSHCTARLCRSNPCSFACALCIFVCFLPGAGSILAALRGPALNPAAKPKQLVIVPNDALMDAHQSELAEEMEKQGWAHVASPEYVWLVPSLPQS